MKGKFSCQVGGVNYDAIHFIGDTSDETAGCGGCVAFDDIELCNLLPACHKNFRVDRRSVIWVPSATATVIEFRGKGG